MWIEALDNGKFKYCERYTDVKGRIRKVAVTLEKNSTRAQNEAARLLYNKIEAKKENKLEKTILLLSHFGRCKTRSWKYQKKPLK